MTKYRWIAARKAEGFPVRLCCRVLEVAPSSYYDWLDVHGAGATDAELEEAYLVNEILSIHATLDDSYGSPRLTHELRRGRCVNHKRVERIVREHALYAKDARRRKCRTTIPDVSAPPMPDLIKRDFSVGAGTEDLRGHHLHPHGGGGCSSPACWTRDRVAAWATPWTNECSPSWSVGLSPWPSTFAVVTSRA